MLKPAICYKEQIENALKEYFYSDDMMYYIGGVDSYLITVNDNGEDGYYQYAVVGKENNLVGYIGYRLDRYSSCAYNFGAFSFDRGNPVMGKELYDLLERLVNSLHRVEFRAISGNPAVKGYDKFLKKHSDIGRKHTLKDVFRDANGNYHDDYIYEFINPNYAVAIQQENPARTFNLLSILQNICGILSLKTRLIFKLVQSVVITVKSNPPTEFKKDMN